MLRRRARAWLQPEHLTQPRSFRGTKAVVKGTETLSARISLPWNAPLRKPKLQALSSA